MFGDLYLETNWGRRTASLQWSGTRKPVCQELIISNAPLGSNGASLASAQIVMDNTFSRLLIPVNFHDPRKIFSSIEPLVSRLNTAPKLAQALNGERFECIDRELPGGVQIDPYDNPIFRVAYEPGGAFYHSVLAAQIKIG